MRVHIINTARSRPDTMLLSAHVPLDIGYRLHDLAEQEGTNVEDLLLQALRLLVGDCVYPADTDP